MPPVGGASEIHPFVPGRPHWWQWLTVLSLDAPLVAIAWQGEIARAGGVVLEPSRIFILGSSVWLAYAVDRWIEGWWLEPGAVQTQRHWFYQRWRWPVAAIWVAVLVAALTTTARSLGSRERTAGLVLLGPVLIYLLSHQALHRGSRWRAPKELCVALLFVAGVVCFPMAQRPALLRDTAVPLACFGVLCFADCGLISLWEAEVDRAHGQTSLATQFPRYHGWVRPLPWIVAAAAAVAALAGLAARPAHDALPSGGAFSDVSEACACAAASGILLGLVDLSHRRLGRQLARSLVDLSLLTPFAAQLASLSGGSPAFHAPAAISAATRAAGPVGGLLESLAFRTMTLTHPLSGLMPLASASVRSLAPGGLPHP